jgi:hypothetical protein
MTELQLITIINAPIDVVFDLTRRINGGGFTPTQLK